MITSFQDENRFLSNFWPAQVVLDGVTYPSVEHAYVAAKTLDPEVREMVRQQSTASLAKRFGRSIELRVDWDDVRLGIMEDLIRQKFQEPTLKAKLMDTGSQELIEGNTWGDKFWGVYRGNGANHLGRILMRIRDEHFGLDIRQQEETLAEIAADKA